MREIEKKAAIAVAAIAALFFLNGWYKYENAADHYTEPGEWIQSESEIQSDVWTTVLPPNKTTEAIFTVNWQHRAGHVFTWEAEKPKDFTIEAHWKQNGSLTNSPNALRTSDWQKIQLDRVYLLHRIRGFVRYTITNTSNQSQAFRFGLQHRSFDSQEPYWANYQPDLCNFKGCEASLTPAALMISESDIKSEASNRMYQGAGIFGLAAVLWIGSFNVLAALFPSETARRIRAGLASGLAYRGKAKNAFRREQDVDDLEELLAEAQERLAAELAIEKEHQTDEDALRAAIKERQADIERVKRSSEKVEQAKRKVQGL